jgi:predicted alpha/beta hydrolase
MIKYDSIFIKVDDINTLHLMNIYTDGEDKQKKKPIFMLHGSMEDGRIFYTMKEKGIAPFLAKKGYDVYVLDKRGRGKSTPAISRKSKYSQVEVLFEDIPKTLDEIEKRNKNKQIWMAHSWGGVLMNAFLARNQEYVKNIEKSVYWGSKRKISTINKERFTQIYLMWGFSFKIATSIYGYLPAKELKFGAENEPKKEYLQTIPWVSKKRWIDKYDKFNYSKILKKINLPKTLYISAKNDKILGNPRDVRDFMKESGLGLKNEMILSKENGNLHDYDHINMLTHKDAPNDQFIKVYEWLK